MNVYIVPTNRVPASVKKGGKQVFAKQVQVTFSQLSTS